MRTLGDMGEKEIIRSLLQLLKGSAAVGPGDDAAAIDIGSHYLVISTDLMTKAGHMPRGMTDWQAGWFLAAVNYSDIAAMGAEPIGIVVAFALPRSTPYCWLEDMMKGIDACSRSIGAEVLGGDTKESPTAVITGTVIGKVEKGSILLRKGAMEGDLLAITGSMGLAAAGYHAAERDIDAPKALKALMEPVPKIREGRILARSGSVTSCMDVTDGLAFSIHQISESSGVKFELNWSDIPIDPEVVKVAAITGEALEDYVLFYGGDYQLLFTIRPEGVEALRSELGGDLTIIGRATGEEENVLIKSGQVNTLPNKGYEHFR